MFFLKLNKIKHKSILIKIFVKLVIIFVFILIQKILFTEHEYNRYSLPLCIFLFTIHINNGILKIFVQSYTV